MFILHYGIIQLLFGGGVRNTTVKSSDVLNAAAAISKDRWRLTLLQQQNPPALNWMYWWAKTG